ncbi:uncharacterized protein LOC144139344 [Haemaphysalis longicornis]
MCESSRTTKEIRLSCARCHKPSLNAVICSRQHLTCVSCTYHEDGTLRGKGCGYCRKGSVPSHRPDEAHNLITHLLIMGGVRACPFPSCRTVFYRWTAQRHYREEHGGNEAPESSDESEPEEQRRTPRRRKCCRRR